MSMNRYEFDRQVVQLRIIQNLMEAGVLQSCPEEIQMEMNALEALDPKDLLTVLLESHNQKEGTVPGIPVPYPITMWNISKN